MKKIIFLFLAAFLMSLPFARAETPADAPAKDETERITARDLWKAFQDDETKATNAHMGKTMLISGVVTGTKTSIYMTPNVLLSDAKDGEVYAICVLPRADFGKLSSFKPGEVVTLRGRIYRAPTDGKGTIIKECRRVVGTK